VASSDPEVTLRPRVIVYIAVSLDGCIARPDGALDWLAPMQVPGEDYGYAQMMAGIDTLVIGRATYDSVLGFDDWPFAGKRVIVLTHRPLQSRHGEESYAGPLAPLLDRLGAEGQRGVYLDGGQAIRQGLAEGVVDEMTLSVVPVLLGSGRRLFADGLPGSRWRLQSSRSFVTGLVQSRYLRD
jgi:dihydrofolate reductase